jgi:hypothetical protein
MFIDDDDTYEPNRALHFANTIANDLQKWKKIIKDGNIKAE